VPAETRLWHDRRGAVGLLFALLAPLLVLAVAFGIDVTAAYRDALHLQALADRAALSGGPLALTGDPAGARAVAEAIVTADGAAHLDKAEGSKRFEVTLSSPAHHLLAGLATTAPYTAHAIASGSQLVE
jgi:Flp pilus assembly protein TadG